MRAPLPLVALLALTLGCGVGARPVPLPLAPTSRAPPEPFTTWTTTLDRDHPLVGRIWSVGAQRFVDEASLRASLRGFVFLGEKHDNADHHRLEGRLIGAMDRPTVVFEMLDRSAQATIDRAIAGGAKADALADVVDWSRSGWPSFEIYRPVFAAALATGQPLQAAGINRHELRALLAGEGSWPSPRPLAPAAAHSLDEELVASHCGMATAAQLAPMGRIQRTRDALMAQVMREARATNPNVVLVAGNGHARRDRGAPYDLAASDSRTPRTSVAFVEVTRERTVPEAYASEWSEQALPFDFVWFTPRATDEDPCEAMHGSRLPPP
jgi:uncharacterized iron-regulated protein